ncbi:GntR family transcriptional regulator [Pokkaliibacter plantistimulans]|uniref:GntR family transcriptional regulator n=1 Tax=Proteobacteria bacterium 228 TaxID=2083153 RepID=A0A2S5KHN6_9PROT|nr:FCD domain-containing protein [Pokkaliibacter plantistimulans]PPC74009.1 GntR family transcriptional regulator [Pokkaliibacter plantistimulans]
MSENITSLTSYQAGSESIEKPELTLSEKAALDIQRAILNGEYQPEQKLGIHELAKKYELGVTPVREGLSRLVSAGLVVAIGNRGFRVAAVSKEDLNDLLTTRSLIELEALRLSMKRGNHEWEAAIVARLHWMNQLTRSSLLEHQADEFDRVHKAFHVALISACGSPRLIQFHSMLYDQTFRYRRLMMGHIHDPADFQQEHQSLADKVINRDIEGACSHLYNHVRLVIPE